MDGFSGNVLLKTMEAMGSTLFEIEGEALSSWVSVFLEEARLHVDDHERDGHDAMRISTHYYITLAEIDRFIAKLQELIEQNHGHIPRLGRPRSLH